MRGCLNARTHDKYPVGMSRAHGATQLQSPEMEEQSLDEGTIASKRVGNQRHRNKHNLNYVLRTGFAGGLAGCAVRTLSRCKRGPR